MLNVWIPQKKNSLYIIIVAQYLSMSNKPVTPNKLSIIVVYREMYFSNHLCLSKVYFRLLKFKLLCWKY